MTIEKFKQNPALLEFLLGTGGAILVESAPRGGDLGYRHVPSNPKALDPSTWRGQNLLDFAQIDAICALRYSYLGLNTYLIMGLEEYPNGTGILLGLRQRIRNPTAV